MDSLFGDECKLQGPTGAAAVLQLSSNAVVASESKKRRKGWKGRCEPHTCPICNSVVGGYGALKSHLQGKHSPPLECDYCQKKYSCKSTLDDHRRRIHGCEPMVRVRGPQGDANFAFVNGSFQCKWCDKHYGLMLFLCTHIIETHEDEATGMVLDAAETDKIFSCDECGKQFLYKQLVRYHKKIRHNPVDFRCQICQYRFCSKRGLQRHLRTSHDNSICPQCGKPSCVDCISVSSGSTECDPENKREERRSLSCGTCGKTFTRFRGLRLHEKKHVEKPVVYEERPFSCDLCFRKFVVERSLRVHKRKIHGIPTEKQHKVFPNSMPHYLAENGNSEKTQELSIDGKPNGSLSYSCKYCFQRFSSEELRLRHVAEIHMNRQKCPFCKVELRRYPMMKHMEKQHPGQKYTCELCGVPNCALCLAVDLEDKEEEFTFTCEVCKKRFKLKASIQKHLKKKHPDVWVCRICLKFKCSCVVSVSRNRVRNQLKDSSKTAQHLRRLRKHNGNICTGCGDSNCVDCMAEMSVADVKSDNPTDLTCRMCEKQFSKLAYLRRHEAKHNSPKKQCLLCPKSSDSIFQSSEQLVSHFRKMHEKKLVVVLEKLSVVHLEIEKTAVDRTIHEATCQPFELEIGLQTFDVKEEESPDTLEETDLVDNIFIDDVSEETKITASVDIEAICENNDEVDQLYLENEIKDISTVELSPYHLEPESTSDHEVMCELCDEGFTEKSYLDSHTRENHDQLSVSIDKMMFRPMVIHPYKTISLIMPSDDNFNIPWYICAKCGYSTVAKSQVLEHRFYSCTNKEKYDHVVPPAKPGTSDKGTVFGEWTEDWRAGVKQKEVTDVELADLMNRFETIEGTNYLKCKDCGRVLKSKQTFRMRLHLNSHNRSFICEICGSRLSTKASYEGHMRIHTGEKPFACRYCDQCFVSVFHRATHEWYFHRGGKAKWYEKNPVQCPECSTICKNPRALSSHKRAVHEFVKRGNLLVSCPECSKICKSRRSLAWHRRTSHEFPVNGDMNRYNEMSCPECSKIFPNQRRLRWHQKGHLQQNNVQCAECGKILKGSNGLRRHMLVFHRKDGVKPKFFQCKICQRELSLIVTVKSHLRSQHAADLPKELLDGDKASVTTGEGETKEVNIEDYFIRRTWQSLLPENTLLPLLRPAPLSFPTSEANT